MTGLRSGLAGVARPWILTVGLATLTGCSVATPVYKDPSATLAPASKPQGALAGLSLRVVLTENTREALKHLADTANRAVSIGNPMAAPDLDPKRFLDDLGDVLSRRFRSVSLPGAVGEQRPADLTLTVDARVFVAQWRWETHRVDLSGAFTAPDEQRIELVSATGTSSGGGGLFSTGFPPAAQTAFAEFAKSLDASTKLAAWATARGAVATPPRPMAPGALRERVWAMGGRAWALVVGINAYRYADRLNYAASDARAIAAVLPGLGFQDVRLLLDEQATKADIERAIYVDFKQRMGPQDRLFVFFAGHGLTVALPRGGEEGYLVPVDGDPRSPEVTAIPMDEIRKMGKRVPAKHIFFAIDSCFSGFAISRDITPESVNEPEIAAALEEPVVQVLTAGRKGQKAVEEEGYGLFTRRLLDGLRGLADRDGRGFVTVTQLAAWLSPRVIRDSGGRQHPQYSALDGEGDFVFLLRPDSR